MDVYSLIEYFIFECLIIHLLNNIHIELEYLTFYTNLKLSIHRHACIKL